MRNIVLALILIVLLGSQAFSRAGTACEVGKRAPVSGFWTWAPGSRLKVYVMDHGFKEKEIPYLLKPLPRWDAVWQTTGAGVRLSYEGTTSRMLDCSNCVTIMRRPVFNKKTRHGSELKAFGEEGTRVIKYAAIFIDPVLTDPQTLSNAVAHELGHSFGLLDCYNCANGSTVMNKWKGMNISNGMEGPTACDVAAIKQAYMELATQAGLASKIVKLVVDEGEEPVEADTRIVFPKEK